MTIECHIFVYMSCMASNWRSCLWTVVNFAHIWSPLTDEVQLTPITRQEPSRAKSYTYDDRCIYYCTSILRVIMKSIGPRTTFRWQSRSNCSDNEIACLNCACASKTKLIWVVAITFLRKKRDKHVKILSLDSVFYRRRTDDIIWTTNWIYIADGAVTSGDIRDEVLRG